MSSRVIFCLSNQKLEKLGGHVGEIVTVSVGKLLLDAPSFHRRHNVTSLDSRQTLAASLDH